MRFLSRCGLLGLCAVVATLAGCAHTPFKEASLTFEPGSASPGMSVRLEADQPVVAKAGRVRVKETTIPLDQVRDSKRGAFTLPDVGPGLQAVQLVDRKGKVLGQGRLEVMPPMSLRVLLEFKGGKARLVSAKPTQGGYSENLTDGGDRLSYDVLNAEGGLLFTGAVANPFAVGHEIYDQSPDGKPVMRREKPEKDGMLSFKIPNVQAQAVIRLFDASAEADLATEKGRAARRLIGEFKIGG